MAAQNFEALQCGDARPEPASLGGLAIDNSSRAYAITNGQWIRLDQELLRTQSYIDEDRRELDRSHAEMMQLLDYVPSKCTLSAAR